MSGPYGGGYLELGVSTTHAISERGAECEWARGGGTWSWVFPPHMPSVSGGRGGGGSITLMVKKEGSAPLNRPNKGGVCPLE